MLNESLKYSGLIKLKLSRNNTLIMSENYHNKGTKSLFQFLAHCLAGEYSLGEALRPKYIRVCHIDREAGTSITSITPSDIEKALNAPISSCILTSATAKVEVFDDSSAKGECSETTLEFSIPFTQLKTGFSINMFALYPSIGAELRDCSAYFILKKKNAEGAEVLNEITTEDKDLNYNLFIEWTLIIKN